MDQPVFQNYLAEEKGKVGATIPEWQKHSTDMKERAVSTGNSDLGSYARVIDEMVEMLKAFAAGHAVMTGVATLCNKLLELVLSRIYLDVAAGPPPQGLAATRGGPQRPVIKAERPKLGKQINEILTRGKVNGHTVLALVTIRRQCKAVFWETDPVQCMQLCLSALNQCREHMAAAATALWKLLMYSNYNTHPAVLGVPHAASSPALVGQRPQYSPAPGAYAPPAGAPPPQPQQPSPYYPQQQLPQHYHPQAAPPPVARAQSYGPGSTSPYPAPPTYASPAPAPYANTSAGTAPPPIPNTRPAYSPYAPPSDPNAGRASGGYPPPPDQAGGAPPLPQRPAKR